LDEILGWLPRDGHTPGKRAVKMGMPTDKARHYDLARRVQGILVAVFGG
jgi:hypothetical protein